MYKYLVISLTLALITTKVTFGAEQVARACSKSDIIGKWKILESKSIKNIPESYSDLISQYQIRVYNKDNSFSQLTSNNKLNESQINNLLSIPQGEKYSVKNGIVTTFNSKNKILEKYGCSYFIKDLPKNNIKKGTLRLLWFKNDKPFIINTYQKL